MMTHLASGRATAGKSGPLTLGLRPARPETGLGRFGAGRKKPGPSQKSPGRPAGFLNFFTFFKRISDLEISSEYQKSKFFSKF
jgi:hypothetical protein